MSIDKRNPLPLYIQIREDLRRKIEKGILKPMEPLPSEDSLCNKYKVSKITIKKALEELKNEGYILRIKRKGTFVNFRKEYRKKIEVFKTSRKILGFIVPDIEDIFISEISKGVEKVSSENHFEVIILNSNRDIEKENSNIRFILENKIDGAIIFPFWGRFNASQILQLKKRNYPFVLIDRYFRDIKTDFVGVDNYRGAYNAVKYLIKLGHKKIAHIMGVDCTADEERFEGYRDALLDCGIPYNLSFVRKIQPFEIEGSLRFEPDDIGGYKEALGLLSRKEKPTAIFAGNDYIALGCYRAIKELGMKIPEDISIMGFDDLKFSSHLEVPLTTVKQPKYEIGLKACEILISKIKKKRKKIQHIVLPTQLVIRSSCKEIKSSF